MNKIVLSLGLCLMAFACDSGKKACEGVMVGDVCVVGDSGTTDTATDARVSRPRACSAQAVGTLGGACDNGMCLSNSNPELECIAPVMTTVATVLPAGGAGPTLMLSAFAGGLCNLEEQCDIMDPTSCGCEGTVCAQGVNIAGTPIVFARPMQTAPEAFCVKRCTPNSTDRGGCPEGQACNINGECRAACTSDVQCKITIRSDGRAVVSDSSLPQTCNTTTGRCVNPGTPSARIGDACTSDGQCTADGVCLNNPAMPNQFPGGYCTAACSETQACAVGSSCITFGMGASARNRCLDDCVTNADCRSGYTCQPAGPINICWIAPAGTDAGVPDASVITDGGVG